MMGKDKRLRVGVVGVGYWGPNLVRNFVGNDLCDVVRVSDLRRGRLDFIEGLYEGIDVTENMNEVINDEGIDAVVIATPVNTHKDIGMMCLKKGKHIFVEKPFTDKYDDGVLLRDTARELGKIAVAGHIFQFNPAVNRIKEAVNEGLLGAVFHYDSQRINLGPPKTTVDVVWDLAPHDLSILLHWFEEPPVSVKAFGSSYWWEGIIDNAHIFMDFKSGKSAHIHVSWLSSNKVRRTLLFGANGNVEYDDLKGVSDKVIFYDKGIDNRINAKDNEAVNLKYGQGEVKKLEVSTGEPLKDEVDAFLNAILTGKEPVNNASIGCEVVKILEEASFQLRK